MSPARPVWVQWACKLPFAVQVFQHLEPGAPECPEGNLADLVERLGPRIRPTQFWGVTSHPQCWDLEIQTLEDGHPDGARAEHIVSPRDWIIRGVEGELYPCKQRIFDRSYRFMSRHEQDALDEGIAAQ